MKNKEYILKTIKCFERIYQDKSKLSDIEKNILNQINMNKNWYLLTENEIYLSIIDNITLAFSNYNVNQTDKSKILFKELSHDKEAIEIQQDILKELIMEALSGKKND